MIKSIDSYEKCGGVGMGVPGPVDTVNGVDDAGYEFAGIWRLSDGKDDTVKRVGLPVYADNDVNVACLAESYHGSR